MSKRSRRWVLGGGLGSGKSAVRQLLAAAGVATFDADEVGHQVLAVGGAAHHDVAHRWPEVIRDGVIDRRALAEIVFSDPGELAALESLTHPHIFDTIRAEVEEIGSVVVVELPLPHHGLGEGWQRMVVDCRDEVRLARAVRRGMDENDVRARMAAQPSRSEWLALADMVIPNHGSADELTATVDRLIPLL